MLSVAVLVCIGIGVGVLVATGTSGLPTTTAVSCVPVQSDMIPVAARWDRVWANGAVHLKRGMFVGLQLEEGEISTTHNNQSILQSFPWTPPVLSSKGVLSATRECRHGPGISTVAIAVYWFEAVSTGKVTVTVPLTEAWTRAVKKGFVPRFQPLRVTVTVG